VAGDGYYGTFDRADGIGTQAELVDIITKATIGKEVNKSQSHLCPDNTYGTSTRFARSEGMARLEGMASAWALLTGRFSMEITCRILIIGLVGHSKPKISSSSKKS